MFRYHNPSRNERYYDRNNNAHIEPGQTVNWQYQIHADNASRLIEMGSQAEPVVVAVNGPIMITAALEVETPPSVELTLAPTPPAPQPIELQLNLSRNG